MVLSPPVPGVLARHGAVRGRTFLHRDLGFRFVFPEAWRICTATHDVVGLSWAQNAIIRLRLLPVTPEDAARDFFCPPEIRGGPLAHHSINGLPALTSGFLMDGGNWMVRGLVAFLTYDGRTYELTGSTTSDVFDDYSIVLRTSLTSFDRLPSADHNGGREPCESTV